MDKKARKNLIGSFCKEAGQGKYPKNQMPSVASRRVSEP